MLFIIGYDVTTPAHRSLTRKDKTFPESYTWTRTRTPARSDEHTYYTYHNHAWLYIAVGIKKCSYVKCKCDAYRGPKQLYYLQTIPPRHNRSSLRFKQRRHERHTNPYDSI